MVNLIKTKDFLIHLQAKAFLIVFPCTFGLGEKKKQQPIFRVYHSNIKQYCQFLFIYSPACVSNLQNLTAPIKYHLVNKTW